MKLRVNITLLVAACLFQPAYSAEGNEEEAKTAAEKKTESGKQAGEEPNGAIRLESVFVGDKEQPAISYFIPWQGVGTPDNLHWNVEEKHDKALDLVDRQIMLRSIHFYGEMKLEEMDGN